MNLDEELNHLFFWFTGKFKSDVLKRIETIPNFVNKALPKFLVENNVGECTIIQNKNHLIGQNEIHTYIWAGRIILLLHLQMQEILDHLF